MTFNHLFFYTFIILEKIVISSFEEFLKSDSQLEYLTIENWILEFFEQKFETNER